MAAGVSTEGTVLQSSAATLMALDLHPLGSGEDAQQKARTQPTELPALRGEKVLRPSC